MVEELFVENQNDLEVNIADNDSEGEAPYEQILNEDNFDYSSIQKGL